MRATRAGRASCRWDATAAAGSGAMCRLAQPVASPPHEWHVDSSIELDVVHPSCPALARTCRQAGHGGSTAKHCWGALAACGGAAAGCLGARSVWRRDALRSGRGGGRVPASSGLVAPVPGPGGQQLAQRATGAARPGAAGVPTLPWSVAAGRLVRDRPHSLLGGCGSQHVLFAVALVPRAGKHQLLVRATRAERASCWGATAADGSLAARRLVPLPPEC